MSYKPSKKGPNILSPWKSSSVICHRNFLFINPKKARIRWLCVTGWYHGNLEQAPVTLFFLVTKFQSIRARDAIAIFWAVLGPEHMEMMWGTRAVSPFGRRMILVLRRFAHFCLGARAKQQRKSLRTSSFWRTYGFGGAFASNTCSESWVELFCFQLKGLEFNIQIRECLGIKNIFGGVNGSGGSSFPLFGKLRHCLNCLFDLW